MADAQIRWNRSDYSKLSYEIRQFNLKIKRLQKEENRLYLPETINYQDTKQNITTRKELNRIINSLRRFGEEGAEELYVTDAGQEITKWERKELGIQKGIATRRLNKELAELNTPNDQGYSRVQMGSVRAREIEAQLKNLGTLESKTGYEFERLKRRIQNIGTSDYGMRKAITYQENYFSMLESYKNFDNYEALYNRLKEIKNPIEFYDFVSQNELLADITFMYDMNMNLGLSNMNEQMSFNQMIESLGIEI